MNDLKDLRKIMDHRMKQEQQDTKVYSDGRVIKTPTWNPTQLKHIGILVRKYRQEKRISGAELERKCGLKPQFISIIERGRWHSLDRMNLESLAYNLDVDITDLLIEVENTKVAIAESVPVKELFSRKRIHSEELCGDDFSVAYEVNENEFILHVTSKGNGNQTIQVYKGKKYRQHPFLAAMEEAIKMIRKAI